MFEKNAFIHHVYFWLKQPGSTEDRDRLVKGLMTLTGLQIVSAWHIGQPAGTDRDVIDRSYAISWLLVFNHKDDQDSYQTHPAHLKFVEDCGHLWSRVVVYDTVSL